jgi:hypothetical protein
MTIKCCNDHRSQCPKRPASAESQAQPHHQWEKEVQHQEQVKEKQEKHISLTWAKEGWGVEEKAAKRGQKVEETCQEVNLPLVQAPHGVNNTQTHQWPPWEAAQGRPKEEAPEGKLCHNCCRCCHSHQPSFCHLHDHSGQPGKWGMMVCTSMCVLLVGSIHGWAIRHNKTRENC